MVVIWGGLALGLRVGGFRWEDVLRSYLAGRMFGCFGYVLAGRFVFRICGFCVLVLCLVALLVCGWLFVDGCVWRLVGLGLIVLSWFVCANFEGFGLCRSGCLRFTSVFWIC